MSNRAQKHGLHASGDLPLRFANIIPNNVDPRGLYTNTCQQTPACPDASEFLPEEAGQYVSRQTDDSHWKDPDNLLISVLQGNFWGSPLMTPMLIEIQGALRAAAANSQHAGNDDAASTLYHWLNNSGSTYNIDVEKLIDELSIGYQSFTSTIKHELDTSLDTLLNLPDSDERIQHRIVTGPARHPMIISIGLTQIQVLFSTYICVRSEEILNVQ